MKNKLSPERLNNVFSGAVAFFTFGALIASILQWNVMSGQLNEMQIQQRPSLWFTNELKQPEFFVTDAGKDTGSIIWNVHYTNHGKNFIAAGDQDRYMKLGPRSEFEKSFSGIGHPSDPGGAIVPVAPQQPVFVTVVSRPNISRKVFNDLMDIDNGISVKLISNYTDFTGKEYYSAMCLTRLKSGPVSFCVEENKVK